MGDRGQRAEFCFDTFQKRFALCSGEATKPHFLLLFRGFSGLGKQWQAVLGISLPSSDVLMESIQCLPIQSKLL